jgi:hypothetical protein
LLTLVVGSCVVRFINLVGVVAGVRRERERETSCVYLVQLSRFHLKTETEFSLRKVVFLTKHRAMDNVQNCDSYSYINIASSQTYR